MVPHGFRFNPTDEELIQFLDRKASGQEMPLHFILETNVYEREPQDLEWNQTVPLSNGERYYYCTRETNYSREVLGRGWWKATSHVKKIHANNDDQLLDWRLCKIKHKGKPSVQEEMESMRKQYSSSNDFEAGSSTNFVGGQQQQEQTSSRPTNYEGYDHESYYQWNNMQQSPPSPYDPYLPAPPSTSSGHYYVEQQEKLESSDEHPFPSLWAWTN
ncbi:NAC domain-containing protein 83-like [Populus alba x Populus x berolinensis]|nr:NAC domain-containing protein 83-like [Populus alba x Populus x berolinensis]KAJ6959205.1 NAC domain-containing protein 83-like [Populus alba x Populus x berolinensis]